MGNEYHNVVISIKETAEDGHPQTCTLVVPLV